MRSADNGTSAQLVRDQQLVATLTLQDGEVWTKSSEDEVLAVMLRLAASLKGRVRGSEGETYRTISASYSHPDDKLIAAAEARRVDQMIRRQRMWDIIRLAVLLLVIGLIVLNRLRQ